MAPSANTGFDRLREAFFFYRNNLYAIATMVLVINTPLVLFQLYLEQFVITDESAPWVGYMPYAVGFLIGPLSSAAVILLIARLVDGREWTLGGVLNDALRAWPTLLIATLMAASIIVLGLFALILPGVYLFVRLAFVEFAVVLEGCMPVAALERGFRLTKDRFWEIFQPLATLLFAYVLLQWLVNGILLLAGLNNIVVNAFLALFFAVLSALFTVLLFRLYQVVVSGGDSGQPAAAA